MLPLELIGKPTFINGEVFISENGLSILVVESDWANNTSFITTIEGSETQKTTLGNFDILSSEYVNSFLYILSKENVGEVYLRIYDREFNLVRKDKIEQISVLSSISSEISIVSGRVYFLLGGNLFLKNNLSDSTLLIDTEVDDISIGDDHLVYIKRTGRNLQIISRQSGQANTLSTIENYGKTTITTSNQQIHIMSAINQSSTLLRIFSDNGSFVKSFNLNVGINKITSDNHDCFYYPIAEDDSYLIAKTCIITKQQSFSSDKLSRAFIHPIAIDFINGKIILLFDNGLAIFDQSGELLLKSHIELTGFQNDEVKISLKNDILFITNGKISTIIKFNPLEYYSIKKWTNEFQSILLPAGLTALILIFIQLYRRQKRVYRELLDLPAAGAVLIFGKHAKLLAANYSARKLLGLPDDYLKRKNYTYYMDKEKLTPLKAAINNAYNEKINKTDRLTLKDENADEIDYLVNFVVLRNPAGLFRGIVLTAVDITEQLERKRLSNWAQLAHDMQTNLSAIRLNTEALNFKGNETEKPKADKILFQTKILMQRIRDIVTVGRDDKLDTGRHSTQDICNDVIAEFDETVFPNVKFDVDCEPFLVKCDKPKFIRALRNAVENGIKSMENHSGTVYIKCMNRENKAIFSVRDTGKGMDELTKEKILKPYFTTRKNNGGSGIGTMIMQNVVEMHKGELVINSEKNVGTEVLFILPNN